MESLIIQTLPDPTRLRLVEALRWGECPVSELVERVDIHQSGVSLHLSILHEAGHVQVRPEWKRRFYSLRPEPLQALEVWALSTTAEGIESWWGPEGLTVRVDALELRPAGGLLYTMTATAPPQVAFMNQHGMPLATPSRVSYAEVVPCTRLRHLPLVDFVPGVTAYDVATLAELGAEGEQGRLCLPVDPMNALQIRVSKLRRALKAVGVGDVVAREGVGYRATIDASTVDALDFAGRIPSARTGGANAAD